MTTQELVSYVPNKDSVHSWDFFSVPGFWPGHHPGPAAYGFEHVGSAVGVGGVDPQKDLRGHSALSWGTTWGCLKMGPNLWLLLFYGYFMVILWFFYGYFSWENHFWGTFINKKLMFPSSDQAI